MKIMAVDIGGTNIKAGVCLKAGELQDVRCIPAQAQRGGRHVVERVKTLIKEYEPVDKIAVSTAGQVDILEGKVSYANENIPGYSGMPIRKILEEQFNVPVIVENDVNAVALGEGAYGAAKNYKDYLCLTYGTGIGGAIVINRRLYRGCHGSAGEFGHMRIKPGGRICACGGRGCYEQYASVNALLRMSAVTGAKNGYEIMKKIERKDTMQERILQQWLDWVVEGLVSFTHLFDPECIILGGGIMENTEISVRVEQKLRPRLMPIYRDVVIKKAALGNCAGMLGVAWLALQSRLYI